MYCRSIAKELSKEDLRRLQLIELEILKEVDRLCRVNKIQYSLIGGTLLGAVRHKGFIPWDDDVDIVMMRSEYDKFSQICEKNLGQEYFFQNYKTDPNYRWGYSKLLKRNTKFLRVGHEHLNTKNGVFIDIFIADAIPRNRFLQKIHTLCCFAVRKTQWSPVGARTVRNPFLRFWYQILACIPRNYVFEVMNKLANSVKIDTAEEFRLLPFPLTNIKKEWLTDLKEMEFEGSMFFGAKDADNFLKLAYGDYMQLPPPENRKGHNTVSDYKF